MKKISFKNSPQNTENKYLNDIIGDKINNILNNNYPPYIRTEYFDYIVNNLNKILTGNHEILLDVKEYFKSEKDKICKTKSNCIKRSNRCSHISTCDYGKFFEFCENRFIDRGYKTIIKEDNRHNFMNLFDLTVCPYCGRAFLYSIEQTSNNKPKVQAQFDHFYSKSKYPFLAISLYNLIPVCSNCNLAKSDDDKTILYPHEENIDDYYDFSYDEINKKISIKEKKRSDKAKNTKKMFYIEELYEKHLDIAEELYFKKFIADSKEYDKSLENLLSYDGYNKEINDIMGTIKSNQNKISTEKKIAILGRYYDDKDQKLILSKFIRDIAKELGLL